MSENLFRSAYIDLDADGGSSSPSFCSTPKNIYWKHKVSVMNSYNMSESLKRNRNLYRFEIPLELAMFLKIGDIITFIQEEDDEDDIFLRFFRNRHPSLKKNYLEWKEFLAENSIGIFIYGRDVLIGLSTVNVCAIYYDQNVHFKNL